MTDLWKKWLCNSATIKSAIKFVFHEGNTLT